MQYICRNHEREGSCYHEFIGGDWDRKTHWSENSLCMHDDIFCDYPEFLAAWLDGIPEFEPFGINRLTRDMWDKIRASAEKKDEAVRKLVREMEPWMEKTFAEYGFITILGI